MFKKTFYTILALGAVITIGMTASGFISTTAATKTLAETTIETETPFAGTWIAGRVSADGKKMSGTGSWTVLKSSSYSNAGKYYIKPDSGKVVSIAVTLIGENDNKYTCLASYMDEDYHSGMTYYRAAKVYTYDPHDNQFNVGKDHAFSFVAYVE